MAIKTIDKEIIGGKGLAKKINKGAEKMVFDILQSTQYSTPIPSTVRELTTNACDSQREKEIAIEILTGESQQNDYYITRNGEQYEDSNFDASYYDIKHLNTEKTQIYISYEKHPGVGYCDKFSVLDHGVGIGGRRLEGVLELGYSTKRNTSENFGAFGLGAKVPLSTGVDFYTIESVYNGKKITANCYNYKTDFTTSKFNLKTNTINPSFTLSDGSVVYCEPSEDKNYTKISFGVKRHNRSKFVDSVEEQLLYLDNVKFDIIDVSEDGPIHTMEKHFKANVLYNSENLIVSDTYVFNKPHIVVVKNSKATTGINYGFIDFRELEMETLWGPIAFKCPARQVMRDPETGKDIVLQEGVDVTPSREKVIWNDATKAYVQGVIKKAAVEATKMVQDELKDTDLISWLLSCRDILSRQTSGTALGRIANIIDKQNLNPKFLPSTNIKFTTPSVLFKSMSAKKITKQHDYKLGKNNIVRENLEGWSTLTSSNLYIKKAEQFNKYKDFYLIEQSTKSNSVSAIIVINEPEESDLPKALRLMPPGIEKAKALNLWNKELARRKSVFSYLESSSNVKSYDDIEVSDDWIQNYKKEATALEQVATFENITPEERRKIEERMVAYTLRFDDKRSDKKHYTWDKIEPRAKDLMHSQKTIYYGSTADEEKFMIAADIIACYAPTFKKVYPENNWSNWNEVQSQPVFYYEQAPVRVYTTYGEEKGHPVEWARSDKADQDWDTPQLIRVRETYIKHIAKGANCKHIDDFFLQLNSDGGYTMDSHLIKWYTGKKIQAVKEMRHLSALKHINPELFGKFKECYEAAEAVTYNSRNWIDINDKDDSTATEIKKNVERIAKFQTFCEEVTDPDLIAAKSRELFVLDMPNAGAYDTRLVANCQELLEYNEEVSTMLSTIGKFDVHPKSAPDLTPELQKEISVYLEAKDRLEW